jgi:ERCC4-type nuclease
MIDNYDISIILIYDDIDSAINYLNRKDNKQYDSIAWRNKLKTMFVGAIGALQVQTSVKVLWVPNLTSAAHCVLATHSHLDGSFQLKKQLPKRTRTDDLRIDMLTQIKGVSPTKAKLLLKKHGSIAEISQLKIQEIIKLDGIGKVLANRILKTLNEEKEVRE